MLLFALACNSEAPPVAPTPAERLAERPELPGGPTLAVGGDVNLGRRTNHIVARVGPAAALGDVEGLRTADLTYANLECVVATGGDYRAEKGESGPYYYRTRPEHLAVLQAAGIDVVGTANNHVGDYGPPGVIEQAALLDAVGIGHPGAGKDRATACAPVFRHVGDLVLAFYAVEATMVPFAATEDRAGTCYLDPERTEDWAAFASTAVSAVRDRAHLVFLGVHWGDNGKSEPTPKLRAAARAVIGGGFDAVLGSSAHLVHGVEVIDGRPVIYDAGNLLFDAKSDSESALFELTLGATGVRGVRITPLVADFGETRRARGPAAEATVATVADRSEALGTTLWAGSDEVIIPLPEPPARPAPTVAVPADPPTAPATPATAPGPQCVADAVPVDAQRPPTRMGPLTLVGARFAPSRMEKRQMVDVETWWTVDATPAASVLLDVRAVHSGGKGSWSGDHEGCDWTWPTDRWTPGTIYYDRYALRPSPKPADGVYTVELGIAAEPLGKRTDSLVLGELTVDR